MKTMINPNLLSHATMETSDSISVKHVNFTLGDALVFMLPIIGLLKVEFGGQLFAHEIILLLIFPFMLLKSGNLLNQGMAKIVLIMGLLWFISQIFTDIYMDTPSEDLVRGWAKITFFLVSFASLVMLLTTPLRIFLWIASSTVPMFVRPFQLFAHDLDPLVLWKFGVGASLIMLVCLPSIWKVFTNPNEVSSIRRIAYLHILFGIGSFFMNARSLAGLSIATGGLLFLYMRYRGAHLQLFSIAIGMLLALATATALISVYSLGASSGFFGDEARSKYEMQNAYGGGALAIILGGRSESIVSTRAIADSPIIGHGSWAKDFKYLIMYVDMRRAFSEDQGNPLDVDANDGLIPSHSYLFGAWVEAGFMGALFWLSILISCIFRVMPSAFKFNSGLSLFAVISMPVFMWNILFSPFGANVRVDVAGILAVFTLVVTIGSQFSGERTVGRS